MKILFITDEIIENKKYGIEYTNAEGNTFDSAMQIYNGLGSICDDVTMLTNYKTFCKNINTYNEHLVFSTYYGVASQNSKALIPAICEANNIKYIGADSYTQMICNDKYLSKKYAQIWGIESTPGCLIHDINSTFQLESIKKLRFPVIIKPNYGGGSNGITTDNIKYTFEDAQSFVKELYKFQKLPILVEEYLPGYELELIIFGNKKEIKLCREVQIEINGKQCFDSEVWGLETKKVDDSTVEWRNSNFISSTDMDKFKALFWSFDKAEIMRIDCRIVNGKPIMIELSPDCYLGEDGGIAYAFAQNGINYSEMLQHIIENSIESPD